MLRWAALVIVPLLLAVPACSDDDDTDRSAVTSIPEDRSTTSSTTAVARTPAPDVIPDDEAQITEEYVAGVLTALESVNLEAFTRTRAAGVVDEDVQAMVLATDTEPRAVESINTLADLARDGFAGYRADPGAAEYTVRDIIVGRPDCIVAEVSVDASAYFVEPPGDAPPGRTMVELLPATPEQRSSGLNPTAWVIDSTPVVTSDDEIPDCAVGS